MMDYLNLKDKSRQKMVLDEVVGLLSYSTVSDKWCFTYRSNYESEFILATQASKNNVVIVLESPHIHEFQQVDLDSLNNGRIKSRPLNNSKTRESLVKIMNYFLSTIFLNNLSRDFIYDVVLVNAIQYQCSLGESTDKNRDEIFILNWLELQDNFIERLKAIAPSFIINCCTKGSWKDNQYIGIERLKKIGLTINKNCKGFPVKLSTKRNDFSLKDIVESKLLVEKMINKFNYVKFDHPSSLNYCRKEYEPKIDEKIIMIEELTTVSLIE